MYQESSGVDDAEYHHIMYNYETLKLPHDPAVELKISSVEHESALSGSDSLTTVTLSSGDTLVPSCISTPLPVTSVLTNTTLTEGVRLPTPTLSAASSLTGNSNSHGLPLTAVSLSTGETSSSSAVPIGHFSSTSVPSTLTVATLSEVASSVHTRMDPMEINQIVHTPGEEVLDGSIVSSSSIDAVVTSMVASSDCQGVVHNGRKIQSQGTGIAKLLSDDSLSLDMVRIIAEQAVESASHQQQGLNVLARQGMVVHTKLADSDIVSGSNLNQYRHVEVLNLRPTIRQDNEGATLCSVVWTCAYCSMAFSSSEAVGQHQEKECTENQSITIATTTSPATVDALMSPLRQVEDPGYDLKTGKVPHIKKEQSTQPVTEGTGDVKNNLSYEIIWSCTVCTLEFPKEEDLGKHHLTHSIQELASALLKLTKSRKKMKRQEKIATSTLQSTLSSPVKLEPNSTKCAWNKDVGVSKITKYYEINDSLGDTPPVTPPQERTSVRVRKKSELKIPSDEKDEKKKVVKKPGKEAKAPRQGKLKGRSMGPGSRDPHTCEICNKVLSCRGNLAKHLVLHESNKPFQCKECGMGFNAKRDRDHHYLQRHTNQRPNICEVCGKGYVDRQYLIEHMVFHGKERCYSCELCGKRFWTAKCVMRHKKRHKREKNFTCTLCLKSFAVKADLSGHIRKVHNSDKKLGNLKQRGDPHHKITHSIQPLQQKHQPSDNQPIKSKDITEFLLPGGTTLPAHLLPADLESADLSGSVSTKEGIFITGDPLGSIIPLAETAGGEYAATVTPIGDHATYVMINSTDDDVGAQSVPATHGLNIMYAAGPASTQQVSELGRGHLSQTEMSQDQHMLVESSLGSTAAGQIGNGNLHGHIDNQAELQHQAQETQTLTSGVTETSLDDGHQGDLNVNSASAENQSELGAASHAHSVVHASHDPGNGFHLELLSQTIQLELQRTQTSTANYLGISDR